MHKKNFLEFCKGYDAEIERIYKAQHLYILSDEEITSGSVVLKPNNTIHRMTDNDMIHYLDSMSNTTKKIIASTDIFLGLGIIHYSFLPLYAKFYNHHKQITEVDLKMEEVTVFPGYVEGKGFPSFYQKLQLKTREDNTVIINEKLILN